MLHQHHRQHTQDSLDLDNQQLDSLNEASLSGTSLQKISLYNNCLTRFPEQIFHHRKQKVLNISCNQIAELPREIGLLSQLQMFDFGHNQAASIPAEIGELRELKYLYLSDNGFSQLPDSLRQVAGIVLSESDG